MGLFSAGSFNRKIAPNLKNPPLLTLLLHANRWVAGFEVGGWLVDCARAEQGLSVWSGWLLTGTTWAHYQAALTV
jgi:hypothetical protein